MISSVEAQTLVNTFLSIIKVNGHDAGGVGSFSRLYSANKELFKYLRGEQRVFESFRVTEANLKSLSLDLLFSSKFEIYRKLSIEFSAFLIKHFHDVGPGDFIASFTTPYAVQMKYSIEEKVMIDLRDSMYSM